MCFIFIILVRFRVRFCDCWRRLVWIVGYESFFFSILNFLFLIFCFYVLILVFFFYIDRVDILRWFNILNCDLMDY